MSKTVQIGPYTVGEGQSPFLIGEVGITASTGLDVGTLGLEHLTLKACP